MNRKYFVSYEVTLDNKKGEIQFPRMCVVCEEKIHGESNVLIQCNPTGRLEIIMMLFSGLTKFSIPVHPGCKKKAQTAYIRNFMSIFLITITLMFGFYFDLEGWKIFSACLVFITLTYIWYITNPAPIEFEIHDNLTWFSFKHRKYTKVFAEINNDRVISTTLEDISPHNSDIDGNRKTYKYLFIEAVIIIAIIGMIISIYFRII